MLWNQDEKNVGFQIHVENKISQSWFLSYYNSFRIFTMQIGNHMERTEGES